MRKTTPKLYTRRSLQLTRPQADYLDAESERLGVAVGELIRRILDEHIGRRDETEPDPRKGKARR